MRLLRAFWKLIRKRFEREQHRHVQPVVFPVDAVTESRLESESTVEAAVEKRSEQPEKPISRSVDTPPVDRKAERLEARPEEVTPVPKAAPTKKGKPRRTTKAKSARAKIAARLTRKKKEPVHIQVGLDFGTSSTKIVYLQLGRRGFRAVDFKHKLPNYPSYCLPSVAAAPRKGDLLLGVAAAKHLLNRDWDSGFQRLKVVVAGTYDPDFKDEATEDRFYSYRDKSGFDDTMNPERLTSIYLAHVMRNVRKIIENTDGFKDADLDLAFNVCMPIDHMENAKVLDAFARVFSWAWLIESAWPKSADSSRAIDLSYKCEDALPKQDPETLRVFAVPEAQASMASYLVSLQKREGLHAMIDLGAGTTDVSICNIVMPPRETQSRWYAARNIPMGTINVERELSQQIVKRRKRKKCTCSDIACCLAGLANMKTPVPLDDPEWPLYESIVKAMNELRDCKDYQDTWGNAYSHCKEQKQWRKLEIFVSGGGACLPYVTEVFSRPWNGNLFRDYQKFPVNRLPEPEDYDGGPASIPFERMSVAYGLAIPVPQLEKYVLPSRVADDTPPRLPVLRLDRDELYPRK